MNRFFLGTYDLSGLTAKERKIIVSKQKPVAREVDTSSEAVHEQVERSAVRNLSPRENIMLTVKVLFGAAMLALLIWFLDSKVA